MPSGVQVAKVDYKKPETLVEALGGQEVLIITMSPTAPKETQMALIDAAAKAKVEYIIPNGWGFDPSHPSSDESFLGPPQRAIQKYIEEVGQSCWIDFVSGPWYELSLGSTADRFGFDFKEKRVTFFDDGNAKINTSTWEQTGRAVAQVLALDKEVGNGDNKLTLSGLKNQLLFFSSFLVSQRDMFQSVLRVAGSREEDWDITYENSAKRYKEGLDAMKQGARTGALRAMYSRSFFIEEDGFGSAAFEPSRGTYNEALGLPVEDLDERTRAAIEMGNN